MIKKHAGVEFEDGKQGSAVLRVEFQKITAQQTQVHLRLSCGSVHGSYCSNIELGGLTRALLYVPILRMHRGSWPIRSASSSRTSG